MDLVGCFRGGYRTQTRAFAWKAALARKMECRFIIPCNTLNVAIHTASTVPAGLRCFGFVTAIPWNTGTSNSWLAQNSGTVNIAILDMSSARGRFCWCQRVCHACGTGTDVRANVCIVWAMEILALSHRKVAIYLISLRLRI